MEVGSELEACVDINERIRNWLKDAINCGLLPESLRINIETKLEDNKDLTSIPFSTLKSVLAFCGKKIYLNELLEGTTLSYPIVPVMKRDPVLEERIQKLKTQQQIKDYNRMVESIAPKSNIDKEDSLGYQYRTLNRQLFMMLNFIITVTCVFIFGYKGTEYYLGHPYLPLVLIKEHFQLVSIIASSGALWSC